uniref:DUF5641 domain-containing protein n=1 Tax=Wuchereria bancrofti TaxID=6293 RepID=A0A1I8EL18_WUCBA
MCSLPVELLERRCNNKFWEKYLQTLRDRKQREHKGPHAQTKRIPQVEEIVLVRTGAVPRGCWPLARITKLIAQAGNIRAAQLKMSNGHIWERPLNQSFCLLLFSGRECRHNGEAITIASAKFSPLLNDYFVLSYPYHPIHSANFVTTQYFFRYRPHYQARTRKDCCPKCAK